MRGLAWTGMLFGLAFTAGCAAGNRGLVLDPVGPTAGVTGSRLDRANGWLQVFTRTEAREDGDIVYHTPSPYSIYRAEGKFVRGIVNHAGANDQRPMKVELPAGAYTVYAPAEGYGQVRVPVVIAEGRLTVVHLAGAGLPGGEELPTNEVVRLPDGRIVGRRAVSPIIRWQPPKAAVDPGGRPGAFRMYPRCWPTRGYGVRREA